MLPPIPAPSRKTSAAGFAVTVAALALIAHFEGTATTSYTDQAGTPTICTGHTRGVTKAQRATLGQCEQWLIEDAGAAAADLARCTTAPITQQQYNALLSLAFNIGGKAYCASTLVRELNAGHCQQAGAQILRWHKIDGAPNRGLQRRRAAESAQFLADC